MAGHYNIAAVTTERVPSWLTLHGSADLAWVVTGLASAPPVIRMGQLRAEDRAKAAGLFTRLQAESLVVVPVTRGHFLTAVRFADQSGWGLWVGDALHVAVAAGLGATLSTLDKRLAEAAVALGVIADMV